MLPLLLTWIACTTPTAVVPAEPRLAVEPSAPAPAYAFARHADQATLVMAPTTRPGGEPAPTTFSPVAPFTARNVGDVKIYSTALPMNFHLFMQRQSGARTFGYYAPDGLEVRLNGEVLPFSKKARTPGSWGYTRDTLLIGLPQDGSAPDPTQVTLTWPKATEEERSLHLDTSGLAPEDFAVRTLGLGTTSHHGLLLPAPATASWTVTVPDNGTIGTRARILPPAISATEQSDGAILKVSVDVGSQTHLVSTHALDASWTRVRADVSAWAGEEVTVRFEVAPGATSTLDLAFLEDPTLYTPQAHPDRVVLAFIDTVRADHLGMYGHTRDTTPKLDAWAADASRFDAHRTVAPWTLPSARTAMTGVQPERFFDHATLADQLAAEGFYTRGIVANAYLSQVFGIHRGFAHYDYRILQPAAKTVEQALDTLEAWPDRDVMLLVQFMEAHLPYMEPPAYRRLFAGEQPEALPSVSRVELVKFHGDEPDFDAVKSYVEARYDQNIRVLDDQVSRLFDAAGPNATTVLFSDHGEEFWDHRGFEHGQSLHDELLHVPFVVRSPALSSGVVTAPTSMLDLTPTVLDAVGLTLPPHVQGTPLRAAANGDAGALAALSARPQGFGRLLYGKNGWAVLDADHKWVHRDGAERLYDLRADPTEQTNIAAQADRGPYPQALAEALDRAVVPLWRVRLQTRSQGSDTRLTLTHPLGFTDAWKGYDPKGLYAGTTITQEGSSVHIDVAANARMAPVVYLRATDDDVTAPGLTLTLPSVPTPLPAEVAEPRNETGEPVVVLVAKGTYRPVIDLVIAPVPQGEEVSAYDPEVAGALEALGYVDPAEE